MPCGAQYTLCFTDTVETRLHSTALSSRYCEMNRGRSTTHKRHHKPRTHCLIMPISFTQLKSLSQPTHLQHRQPPPKAPASSHIKRTTSQPASQVPPAPRRIASILIEPCVLTIPNIRSFVHAGPIKSLLPSSHSPVPQKGGEGLKVSYPHAKPSVKSLAPALPSPLRCHSLSSRPSRPPTQPGWQAEASNIQIIPSHPIPCRLHQKPRAKCPTRQRRVQTQSAVPPHTYTLRKSQSRGRSHQPIRLPLQSHPSIHSCQFR